MRRAHRRWRPAPRWEGFRAVRSLVASPATGEPMARILLAEDEEALRALTARALTDAGHEVLTAVDGAEALDIITREAGRFDLLLTDIKMPLMDGIALALSIARDHPRIIILLRAAYPAQRDR